ncbi:MAG: dihydrodipicolinate synthase family protein [Armatimonadota bacterium]
MSEPITGMIVATLTPFREGRVDAEGVRRHVARLAEAGIPAVAPAGTTGEFLYLSEEERAEVVRASVEGAAGRLRVIAGIWALDPAGVGRLARAAEAAGADAVFLTTPIYYPATDEAVYRWYASAREQTSLPLFAYHIPQYAVNGVSTAVLDRLLRDGVVQGIKDSTGKPERLQELLDTVQGRAPVYGASDSFALRARRMGADGFISALANLYPRTFVRIWNGDAESQATIDRVRTAVKGYGGIGGLKALLRAQGFDFGETRLPFGDLEPAEEAELRQTVAALGELA